MIRTRTASLPIRLSLAALLTLLFGLRFLSPAGFMPMFERGAVTIVACPGVEPGQMTMPMRHDGHPGGGKAHQQPCPYAAAASVGPLPWVSPGVMPAQEGPSAISPLPPVQALASRADRARPPSTGPPLLPA